MRSTARHTPAGRDSCGHGGYQRSVRGYPLRLMLRRLTLLAGAVALVVQMVAWALVMPARSLAADLIPICAADGTVHLVADDGADDPAPPSHHAGADSCPLCPLIGGLSTPPPPALPLLPQTIARHGPEALPGDLLVTGWFLSTLQARAPPV